MPNSRQFSSFVSRSHTNKFCKTYNGMHMARITSWLHNGVTSYSWARSRTGEHKGRPCFNNSKNPAIRAHMHTHTHTHTRTRPSKTQPLSVQPPPHCTIFNTDNMLTLITPLSHGHRQLRHFFVLHGAS